MEIRGWIDCDESTAEVTRLLLLEYRENSARDTFHDFRWSWLEGDRPGLLNGRIFWLAFEIPYHQRQLFEGFVRDVHDHQNEATRGLFVSEDVSMNFRCTWELSVLGITVTTSDLVNETV